MTTILKEMGILQLCSKNERTLEGHFLLQFLIETIIKNNRSVRTKAVNVLSLGSEYSNILFLVSVHKSFLYTTGEMTFNVDQKLWQ